MAWADFFVLCLAMGFVFSLLVLISGAAHLPHLHLHLHWPGAGHLPRGFGAVNTPSLGAFLIWFGASGYLLSRFADWRLLFILAVASLFGFVGAGIVFWFLARVLLANERPLNAADYEMTGVLGRLSGAVRARGTGEMIFIQAGRRCGVPVRSESGDALPDGIEVIVTQVKGGIAYVRTWDEMQSL